MNHQFSSPQIHVAADALAGLGIVSANRFSIVLPLGSASAAQDQNKLTLAAFRKHLRTVWNNFDHHHHGLLDVS
jgi:hypothetical protein